MEKLFSTSKGISYACGSYEKCQKISGGLPWAIKFNPGKIVCTNSCGLTPVTVKTNGASNVFSGSEIETISGCPGFIRIQSPFQPESRS
ncbi:MAG: hypothetical protein JJU29_06750 [Verrucomicrobia bacterium]|nr:hypothetical protein [Verrucomicrobiota bacterium]MCH8511573.1 hypothetical protein [Kiritimatiellia bacterium]